MFTCSFANNLNNICEMISCGSFHAMIKLKPWKDLINKNTKVVNEIKITNIFDNLVNWNLHLNLKMKLVGKRP